MEQHKTVTEMSANVVETGNNFHSRRSPTYGSIEQPSGSSSNQIAVATVQYPRIDGATPNQISNGTDIGKLSTPEPQGQRRFALVHCGIVLVEVVVFLYFLATFTLNPVTQFFLIKRTMIEHINWTYPEVLDKVSDYNMFLSFSVNFPAILPTLLLGTLADRFGRKTALLCTLFGNLAKISIYIMVIHLDLRIECLYIGNFLDGLVGSYGAFLMGVYGMIADMTQSGQQRNIRITTTEAATFIASAAGTTAAGYWVKDLGHESPMIFAGGAVLTAILFCLLFLPESIRRENIIRMSLKSLKRSYVLFTSHGPRGRRPILLLTVLLFFVGIYLLQGNSITIILYLQFVWSRVHDSTFALLGVIGSSVGFLVQGLADKDAMMYGAAVAGGVGNFLSPMSRAIMSKSVQASDQGSLFAGVGVAEMLATTIAGVSAPALFKLGLRHYNGLHSLVFSGLAAICIPTVCALKFVMRRADNTTEKTIAVEPGENAEAVKTRM